MAALPPVRFSITTDWPRISCVSGRDGAGRGIRRAAGGEGDHPAHRAVRPVLHPLGAGEEAGADSAGQSAAPGGWRVPGHAASFSASDGADHGVAHGLGAEPGRPRLHDVRRCAALGQHLPHRALDQRRLGLLLEGMAQHHGGREDGGERVGHVLAGDVGRRAVHRLVQALAARRSSEAEGSMPIEPVSIAAASDRMSPNMLPVTITSNVAGPADQVHRRGVDVHRGAARHPGSRAPPRSPPRARAGWSPARWPCRPSRAACGACGAGLEAGMGDAVDLGLGVAHGVEGAALGRIGVAVPPRGLPK